MGCATAAVAAAAAVLRRVEVRGDSMLPTLAAGDRVLAVRGLRARPGDVVVVRDPRHPSRLLVKRVAAVGPAGVEVVGDNGGLSTDSRVFGPVPVAWGRVVYRYAPAARAGRLGRYDPDVAQALDLDRLLADEYVAGIRELPTTELRARKAECSRAEGALSYLRRLVQVRLDIVQAEIDSRDGGGTGDLSELVEHLPEILAERGTRTVAGRLTSVALPDVDHDLLTADLDAILDVDKAGALPDTDVAELRRVLDELGALERTVSTQRRALHERLDALQAELVRRYRTGEATVDSLLG
ncbi:MAG TPA: nickel-type superoxide dismutase maturation protease [Acidimicrobiales bacterium]|nr:nickel-type superoxide dismutase maturation protease [Acidimicrobiales bacterium]